MKPIFSVQPVLLLQDAAKPFIRTVLACKCHIQFLQRWHRFYWHLFVFFVLTGGLSCKPTATVITYPASFCKKNAIISSKKKDCWKNNLQCFIKFIHSEKATNFCEISDLSYVVMVKSTLEISQNFVSFSEYMNFSTLQ